MRIILSLLVVAFPLVSVSGSSGQTDENSDLDVDWHENGLVSDGVPESMLWNGEEPHTDPSGWSAPRLFHTIFEEEYEDRIILSMGEYPNVLPEAVYSGNGAYYFLLVEPDFERSGPWSTRIVINAEQEEPILIDLIDHSSYSVVVKWINEKLLFGRIWWGRVLGTDFVFDVEARRMIFKEMVNDGCIPYQQSLY